MSETPLVQIACAKCGRRLGVRAMSKDGPQWTEHFVSAEVAAAVADEAGWNIDAQGATCLGCQPPPEAHCYDCGIITPPTETAYIAQVEGDGIKGLAIAVFCPNCGRDRGIAPLDLKELRRLEKN